MDKETRVVRFILAVCAAGIVFLHDWYSATWNGNSLPLMYLAGTLPLALLNDEDRLGGGTWGGIFLYNIVGWALKGILFYVLMLLQTLFVIGLDAIQEGHLLPQIGTLMPLLAFFGVWAACSFIPCSDCNNRHNFQAAAYLTVGWAVSVLLLFKGQYDFFYFFAGAPVVLGGLVAGEMAARYGDEDKKKEEESAVTTQPAPA